MVVSFRLNPVTYGKSEARYSYKIVLTKKNGSQRQVSL